MKTNHLTIRSVKAILTRAGFDYSELSFTIINRSGSHMGGRYTGHRVEQFDVRIAGQPDSRRTVRAILGERGLEVAPMPDHDDWSRGSVAIPAHG